MPAISMERKVGLTVLASLACFGGLVVFLGKIHLSSPGYPLFVDYNYVDSLKPDAPVLYGGGVKVGTVDGLEVNNGKVRVSLHIFRRYQIPKDSRFTIHTSGILGEKYVQIDAGDLSTGVLDSGTQIVGADPGSLDRTLQRIETLTDFLEPLLADPKFKRGFGDTMQNLNRITEDLASLVEGSSGDIRESVKNLKELSAGLRAKVDDMKGIIDNAKGMVNDTNRKNLQESLQNLDGTLDKLNKAMTQIDSKKGPLGAAIYDDQMAQDLRDILRDLKSHPWKLLWKK
jgi:phospholipid/cholesterol/gamma-HCH transport system substrate-binding protein